MLTNRRRSDGSGARPEISRRQEKVGCLPCSTFSRVSAIATTAGRISSSVVFLSRTPSSDCEMAPRIPRSVGSRASVPRKGSALISSFILRCTSSTLRNRIPLRAKNSPPSGRVMVRIMSFRSMRALTNASAASSAASGVLPSMTAINWSVRCGKRSFSLISCWRQGSELDKSLPLSVLMAMWRVT